MTYLILALIGLAGGFASGLLGVGGGTIFVPLMILICRMDPHLAIGTSLAVVVPTAIAGAVIHGRASMVDWRTVLVLTGCAVLGAWLGSVLSLKVDPLLLKKVFALFLFLMAVKLFFSN